MKPLILVLIFSVFEYLSATIDNGYGYVNGYAMAVGGVSSVLSCGLFVASLQPSRLMKMVLCARHRKVEDHRGITRTVKTRWPAGDVTMERLLAFVLFMWWMVAAAFLKFDGPMAVKFNGYLSTFGALWAASLHVGETEVPPPAHRGPPPDSSPQLLYFFCCVLTLDEALDTSLEEAAEMVQEKLDEMGVGEEAQGYAVMAGDEELEQVLAVVLSSIGLCYAGPANSEETAESVDGMSTSTTHVQDTPTTPTRPRHVPDTSPRRPADARPRHDHADLPLPRHGAGEAVGARWETGTGPLVPDTPLPPRADPSRHGAHCGARAGGRRHVPRALPRGAINSTSCDAATHPHVYLRTRPFPERLLRPSTRA